MKNLTLASLALSLAALTACAPTPAKVCEHAAEIMEQELDEAAMTECTERVVEEMEACGSEAKATMRCLMAAEDLEGFRDCDCDADEEETEEAPAEEAAH